MAPLALVIGCRGRGPHVPESWSGEVSVICILFLFGLSERGRPWTSQVPQKFHSFHSWRRFGPDLEEKSEVHLRRLRHVLQSLQDRCTMATGCIYLTMAASMDLRPARGPSDHSFFGISDRTPDGLLPQVWVVLLCLPHQLGLGARILDTAFALGLNHLGIWFSSGWRTESTSFCAIRPVPLVHHPAHVVGCGDPLLDCRQPVLGSICHRILVPLGTPPKLDGVDCAFVCEQPTMAPWPHQTAGSPQTGTAKFRLLESSSIIQAVHGFCHRCIRETLDIELRWTLPCVIGWPLVGRCLGMNQEMEHWTSHLSTKVLQEWNLGLYVLRGLCDLDDHPLLLGDW